MRIAIIGTGISGLVSAWMLQGDHEITVYEASDRIGGHTHTHELDRPDGRHRVDSGFIVFNRKNYPKFSTILERLGVAAKPTDMSFGVRSDRDDLEYNGTDLNTLFAQRRNILRPSFWRMVRGILRFNRRAMELLNGPADYELELGDWLDREGFSRELVEHYVLPMGSALWSAPPETTRRYPARYFVEFFANHDMLNIDDRPQWLVVDGGSSTYVDEIIKPFHDRIRTGTPVSRVARSPEGVVVEDAKGGREVFDQVVIASHSDQALRMLAEPTAAEREILGALPYRRNEVVLHTDTSIMPRRRKAWAAWNYRLPDREGQAPAITYDMNVLQSLEAAETFLVTLDRPELAESPGAIDSFHYEHPVYTPQSQAARLRRDEISGADRIWYCGAYWGHGFHEDGVNSALAVARGFGKTL